MTLKCLTIVDADEIEEKLHKILLTERVEIIKDNRYLLNPEKMAELQLDIVIVSLDAGLAISLLEDFCRLSPDTTLIYLVGEGQNSSASLMFYKTVAMMVDHIIPMTESYKIASIINEIYNSLYYSVRKIAPNVNFSIFSAREIEILTWMQIGLSIQDLPTKLNIGRQAIRKHISNCSTKLGCHRDDGSVVAISFRKLGDLTERANKDINHGRN